MRQISKALGSVPSLKDVIGFLDGNPQLTKINAGVSEKTGPLTSYTLEQRAQWKAQQVLNSVEWRGDWSWLTRRFVPEGAVPIYCGADQCYLGYVSGGALVLADAKISEGEISCGCGAGRKWYRDPRS